MTDQQYSEPQLDKIADDYFGATRPRCPECDAPLAIHLHGHGTAYILTTTCSCGRVLSRPSGRDPLREKFREFTAVEKADLLAAHSRRKVGCCPVDGSILRAKVKRTEKGPTVYLSCPRCGGTATHMPD